MEEARGDTFLWNELGENFIKDFNFIPQTKTQSKQKNILKNLYIPQKTNP